MWHSTNPMPGQPGLFLLAPETGVSVSNRLFSGHGYEITQSGAELTIPLQSVGAIHSFWMLPPRSEIVFSLGSRYSLRALSRPASPRTLNSTIRQFEWLFELRDNAAVMQSATCSTISASETFDEAVYGPFTGLSLCVGYAVQASGQGVMYFHGASHKMPTFNGGVASFGATTCALRANINIADATQGASTIAVLTVGYTNVFAPYARLLQAIARSGPFESLTTDAPDSAAVKATRKGEYPASLRSNALQFREITAAAPPLLSDSAGHCEVALQTGFTCASNALPMRDVAFMPPDVGWRSNISASYETNRLLSRLEITTPRFFSSVEFFYSFYPPGSASIGPANVIYSSDARLAVGQKIINVGFPGSFSPDTYITAIDGISVTISNAVGGFRPSGTFLAAAFLLDTQETIVANCTLRGNNEYHYESGGYWAAADIALTEVMEGNSLSAAALSNVFAVRVYTALAVGSGFSGAVLTQGQANSLLAGDPVTLPKPNDVQWESGHIIQAVGP